MKPSPAAPLDASRHRSAGGGPRHRRAFACCGAARPPARPSRAEDRQDLDRRRRAHAAGSYTPAGGAEIAELPAFCRVHGVVSPVEGSHVGFEVWLPKPTGTARSRWSATAVTAPRSLIRAMADQLKQGYAAVATDTGHKGDDPDFAVGDPEAIVDWASRAVHVSIDAAKPVVADFYGQAARHAYFWGCSTGGQQALTEAQRYPNDFDGILAGDPGNNRTHLNAGFLWQFVKNHRSSDLSVIVPPEKLALVTDAVVKACRGKDGGAPTDEFLTDPRSLRIPAG